MRVKCLQKVSKTDGDFAEVGAILEMDPKRAKRLIADKAVIPMAIATQPVPAPVKTESPTLPPESSAQPAADKESVKPASEKKGKIGSGKSK